MLRASENAKSNPIDQGIRVDRPENFGAPDFVALREQARTEHQPRVLSTKEKGTSPYINQPTEKLVTDVEEVVDRRGDLRECGKVAAALAGFKLICRKPPAIVKYIRNKTDTANPEAGFTRDQIKLHMLATVARSSSTWGTIQAESALLSLAGDHDFAATINSNAINETGDKAHRPHPLLLFDCFDVVAKALNLDALRPASYHLARHIHRLRKFWNDNTLSDVNALYEYLVTQGIRVRHTPHDMQVALAWIPTGKKTANGITGLPACFSL